MVTITLVDRQLAANPVVQGGKDVNFVNQRLGLFVRGVFICPTLRGYMECNNETSEVVVATQEFKKPNRSQVMDILSRFRSAKTERERRLVANSIKKDFPDISKNLIELIEEGAAASGR